MYIPNTYLHNVMKSFLFSFAVNQMTLTHIFSFITRIILLLMFSDIFQMYFSQCHQYNKLQCTSIVLGGSKCFKGRCFRLEPVKPDHLYECNQTHQVLYCRKMYTPHASSIQQPIILQYQAKREIVHHLPLWTGVPSLVLRGRRQWVREAAGTDWRMEL